MHRFNAGRAPHHPDDPLWMLSGYPEDDATLALFPAGALPVMLVRDKQGQVSIGT